jgi:hypothetical protein
MLAVGRRHEAAAQHSRVPGLKGSTSYDQKVEARIEFGSERDAEPNQ